MPLQDFSFGDGSINPLALLEQACAVQAVTADNRAALETLLANSGGGTVLAFHYQSTTWPPSWSLSRQGNDLIISVAGTANILQWFGDVIGVFAIDYPGNGCKRHSFFAAAAISVLTQMQAFFPPDVGQCRLKIAGTSYGGAVAFLIALQWLSSFPGADVQQFGIASPKSLTTGYTGPLPRVIRNPE